MCGICGIFDLNNEHRANEVVIQKMTEKLLYRGPDAANQFIRDNIAATNTQRNIR